MSGPGLGPDSTSGHTADQPEPPGATDPVGAAYTAFGDSAAALPVPRDVVRASGPDAESYLQGQCSQDLSSLAAGGSAESLLLSPQGKVEVYLRMTRLGDQEFLLDTDRGFGSVLVARLERFRLRTKIDFEPLEWVCLAVRGPDATRGVTGTPELVVPVTWPGLEGVDLLGPPPAEGAGAWVADSVVAAPLEAWEAVRIEAGVPVNGRELVEGTIAAEVGLVERTVSFTKGCFTGQELVARLDARGSKVARRLRGLVLEDGPDQVQIPADAAPTLVGSAVWTQDGEHEVGHLSSSAWSPGYGSPVALATLHRRVEVPEAVVVVWVTETGERRLAAEARALPLAGGDRGS